MLNSRFSGDMTDSTPSGVCTRISYQSWTTSVSMVKGRPTFSRMAVSTLSSSMPRGSGRGAGSSLPGSIVTMRSVVRAAMASVSRRPSSVGSRSSISMMMAMSPATAEASRRVMVSQWRS